MSQEEAEEPLTPSVQEFKVDTTEINSNLEISEPGSYKNLQTLILASEGVQSIFNAIYSEIPEEPQAISEELTDEQASLDWYQRAQSFVKNTIDQQDKIKRDIDFINQELSSIVLTQEGLINYFDLETKHQTALSNQMADRPEFVQLKESFDALLDEASAIITESIAGIEQLYPKVVLIMTETQFIKDNLDSSSEIDVQKKADVVAQVIPKIVEIKLEIDTIISEILGSLKDLESRRNRADMSLDVMIDFGASEEDIPETTQEEETEDVTEEESQTQAEDVRRNRANLI